MSRLQTTAYYFTGVFSTVVVVPAAYNFVINFMSNHTKEELIGYLDGYNFKSFFGAPVSQVALSGSVAKNACQTTG